MKAPKGHSTDGIEILIVEDSATQAAQLMHLLEQQHYVVFVAGSGKQALAHLNEHKPALIISDIIMPEMGGYELCKHVKSNESSQDIPVILLTSLSNSEDVLEGLACGADNFITKPYNEEYLLLHLEQILASKKLHKNERVRIGVEIMFGGKRRFVTADQQQMLTLLISTYEAAVLKNAELVRTQHELQLLNERLEELVEKRTAALSAEVAIRKHSEEQVQRLNRVYALLSNINQAIVRIHDVHQLLNDACMIAADEGRFQGAWIGLVNNETHEIEVSASAALASDFLDTITKRLDGGDADVDPIAAVIRSGQHLILNDITADNRSQGAWERNSFALGFRSIAVLPLVVLAKTVGIFCVYSKEVRFFDQQEIGLLDEVANDVSFALEFIQKEAERQRAEEELVKLRKAIDTSGEAIFVTDPKGIITYVNPAFTATYGYPAAEVVDKVTPRILKSGFRGAIDYKIFWENLLAAREVRSEYKNKRKDGTIIEVEGSAIAILDEEKNITGFLGIQHDISQKKILEAQLRQAQKLESIGTLAGGIAHDFNNILGIIIAYGSLLQRDNIKPGDLKQYTNTMMKAAERGAGLVKQILTFARKREVSSESVQVNYVVKELVSMLYQTFPKTIGFSVDLDRSLPPISADSGQLYQALMNLCVNARDAILEATKTGKMQSQISITTATMSGEALRPKFISASSDKYVAISVSDTGTGIDEQTRQRIFEPFFTTREVGKGTGLGLAVVYGIAQHHQGFIDLKSAVGEGTTFTLYFPVVKDASAQAGAAEMEVSEITGGNETVLVVEDEDALRMLLKNLLEAKGYRVLTASDGFEAVSVFEKHRDAVAIVVSDHGLPGMNGADAAKKMIHMKHNVKCLIATGYLEPNQKSEIFKSGVKEIIQKPYNPIDVLRKVREVLDVK